MAGVSLAVTRLAPHFAARIDGADIRRPLAEETWAAIRAAFEEHSVLTFRDQPLDDHHLGRPGRAGAGRSLTS